MNPGMIGLGQAMVAGGPCTVGGGTSGVWQQTGNVLACLAPPTPLTPAQQALSAIPDSVFKAATLGIAGLVFVFAPSGWKLLGLPIAFFGLLEGESF